MFFFCRTQKARNIIMSEALARKQLHRQGVLQQRVVLPAGRIISKEEGRAAARKDTEEVGKWLGDDSDASASAAPSAVVLESSVSKKIVTLRQKHNKRENLSAALASFRDDQIVANLVDSSSVRKAAAKLYAKDAVQHDAIRAERNRRAVQGPAKAAKKAASQNRKK